MRHFGGHYIEIYILRDMIVMFMWFLSGVLFSEKQVNAFVGIASRVLEWGVRHQLAWIVNFLSQQKNFCSLARNYISRQLTNTIYSWRLDPFHCFQCPPSCTEDQESVLTAYMLLYLFVFDCQTLAAQGTKLCDTFTWILRSDRSNAILSGMAHRIANAATQRLIW